MENLYNLETLLLFLGGIFTFLLPVVIIYSKREGKRDDERKRLEELKRREPAAVGDIEQKLNDSFEFKKLSFIQLLAVYALQPLFIISFINLFNKPLIIDVVVAFGLILFIIMHEFWASSRFSSKRWYQFVILGCWLVLFVFISLKNNREELGQKQKSEQIHQCPNDIQKP